MTERKQSSENDVARPTVLLLGPALDAVSGVSSHLNLLLSSALPRDYRLEHFQVGSEGRDESRGQRWRRLLRDPLRLYRRLRRGEIQAVHVNSSLNARAYWRDLGFLFAAALARTPVIFQVHGGALPRQFFRGNRLLTAWLRLTLRLPRRIVVLGQLEAEAWRRFLPGRRIDTIPNAIDCRPFSEGGRQQHGQRLRAVYLGRLAAGKGLCELLHGIAATNRESARPRLVIAGSGPERRYLQTLVRDLGIEDDVEFAGAVFGADKQALLESADLFLLPSYSEGLPYALLEAMAAGAVPLTTPVGAIPDVVDDGVHGLYIVPRDPQSIADALRRVHRDRGGLERMRVAGRQRVLREFDLRRLERDFHKLYGDLSSATDLRCLAEA